MKIQVLTFGIARDIAGAGKVELDVPDGSTAAEVEQQLREKFPALNRLGALHIAVNSEYAGGETVVYARDEIALIPPVSGG